MKLHVKLVTCGLALALQYQFMGLTFVNYSCWYDDAMLYQSFQLPSRTQPQDTWPCGHTSVPNTRRPAHHNSGHTAYFALASVSLSRWVGTLSADCWDLWGGFNTSHSPKDHTNVKRTEIDHFTVMWNVTRPTVWKPGWGGLWNDSDQELVSITI